MKRLSRKPNKQELIGSIASYLGAKDEIMAAYLFGTFLSEATYYDIDIGLLVGKEPQKVLNYEFGLEADVEKIVKCRVDVRVLNRAPLSFCQNVIRKGKVILDRNPSDRADFENSTLKKYFDFAFYRRRYLAEVLHASV